ncbi:MAG: OmpH family outer membrane protein [Candidatus Acidiferrales bacterium]
MRTLRMIFLLAIAALVAVPLAAQKFEPVPQAKPADAPAAPGAKIGVLNLQAAVTLTQEGQKASEELQAKFGPRNADLQKLVEEGRGLEEQLRSQERTLSDEARAQLLRDLELKRKYATRLQEDLQEEMQDAQSEVANRILAKMDPVIKRYATENTLDLIITSGPSGPVVFATAPVNITQAIIKLYDQTYPVQTAEKKPPAQPPAKNPAPPQKPPQ